MKFNEDELYGQNYIEDDLDDVTKEVKREIENEAANRLTEPLREQAKEYLDGLIHGEAELQGTASEMMEQAVSQAAMDNAVAEEAVFQQQALAMEGGLTEAELAGLEGAAGGAVTEAEVASASASAGAVGAGAAEAGAGAGAAEAGAGAGGAIVGGGAGALLGEALLVLVVILIVISVIVVAIVCLYTTINIGDEMSVSDMYIEDEAEREEFESHKDLHADDVLWYIEHDYMVFKDGTFGVLSKQDIMQVLKTVAGLDDVRLDEGVAVNHDHAVYKLNTSKNIDYVCDSTSTSYAPDTAEHQLSECMVNPVDYVGQFFPAIDTSGSSYSNDDYIIEATTGDVYHLVRRSDVEGDIADGAGDRFGLEWQAVLVLCNFRSISNGGNWTVSEGSVSDESVSSPFPYISGELDLSEYFLSEADVEDVCSTMTYTFRYYYDVISTSRATGSVSAGSIEDELPENYKSASYKYADPSNYSWRFHDVDTDCDDVHDFTDILYGNYMDVHYGVGGIYTYDRTTNGKLDVNKAVNAMSSLGYSDGLVRVCREPFSAPSVIENGYETITYMVTDVRSDPTLIDKFCPYTKDYEKDDIGGVITGCTVRLTPHKFYDECMRVTNNTFEWGMFISLLEQLPNSESQVEFYRHLYELWRTTEDDTDPSLVEEKGEGEFGAYGVILGRKLLDNVSEEDPFSGLKLKMYVTGRTGRATADAYFTFLASSFMPLTNRDYTASRDQLYLFLQKLNTPSATYSDLADAFYWYMQDNEGDDITAITAIWKKEGGFHDKGYQSTIPPGSPRSNNSWASSNYTFNYNNSTTGNPAYYTYFANPNKLTSMGGADRCVHYSEVYAYVNVLPTSVKSSIISAYNATAGSSPATSILGVPNAFVVSYLLDANYLYLNPTHKFEDMYEYVKQNKGADIQAKTGHTFEWLAVNNPRLIQNYCAYYCMGWVSRNYWHGTKEQDSFFKMCWYGIEHSEILGLFNLYVPKYYSEAAVRGAELVLGYQLSDTITHSYCPWFDGYVWVGLDGTSHWAYGTASYRNTHAAMLSSIIGTEIWTPTADDFDIGDDE